MPEPDTETAPTMTLFQYGMQRLLTKSWFISFPFLTILSLVLPLVASYFESGFAVWWWELFVLAHLKVSLDVCEDSLKPLLTLGFLPGLVMAGLAGLVALLVELIFPFGLMWYHVAVVEYLVILAFISYAITHPLGTGVIVIRVAPGKTER